MRIEVPKGGEVRLKFGTTSRALLLGYIPGSNTMLDGLTITEDESGKPKLTPGGLYPVDIDSFIGNVWPMKDIIDGLEHSFEGIPKEEIVAYLALHETTEIVELDI